MLRIDGDKSTHARLSAEGAAQLLRRVHCGDSESAAELYVRYNPYLVKILRRDLSVRDSHDREDLAQRVFGILLRPTTNFNPQGNFTFECFLYRIARNESFALSREKGRQETSLSDAFISGWKRNPYDVLPDPRAERPEVGMMNRERCEQINDLIDELPKGWRGAMKERINQYPENVDVSSIAHSMNTSRNTVGVWLYRARHQLSQAIKELVRED